VGSHVYLTSSTSNDSGLYVVDVSSPSNPALVGSKITHADLKNNLRDVVAAGNRLYVASTSNDSVVVFDITSRTAPAHVATVSHQHLDGVSWLAVDDNYVYALGSTMTVNGQYSNLAVIGEAG